MMDKEEQLKNELLSNELYRSIRGDSCLFKTPPEVNGEMLPTDHAVFLETLARVAGDSNSNTLKNALEAGIKEACSDAIGTYCAVQCYYNQIIEEEYGSSISIDKKELPSYLGKKVKELEADIKQLQLSDHYDKDYAWDIANSYIEILDQDYNIKCFLS